MTTFEIFVLIALAIIVGCAVITVCTVIEGFHGVWQNQSYNYNELRKIVVSTSETLSDISRQLANIEDNILDDLRDIRIAQELGKTSPNTPLPCYHPNGICTNPQMDCINCPKRGTGGTWSTNISIKAEDAPLQERFNDSSKED